jgi:hypothetical protein
MNLDLGGTIWLNVSKQLLNYHKWFFTPFEKMPKRVYEEFKRHKHTHPPIRLKTSVNGHEHKVTLEPHHSHTHPDWSGASSSTSHTHSVSLSSVDCGSGATHSHTNTLPAADAHRHDCILSFGAANLGSPNWWEHVHPITLTSIGSAGTSHRHSLSVTSSSNYCIVCRPTGHYHGSGTGADGYAGGAHTHTLGAVNTGNAYSTDTHENHRHPFSVSLDAGGEHSHAISGTPLSATCAGGYSHNHTYGATSTSVSHTHTLSGDTGYGGEPLPVIGVPRFIGDSLSGAVIIV